MGLRMLKLIVVSIYLMHTQTVAQFKTSEDRLQEALSTLMSSGTELDEENDHLESLSDREDVPASYQRVINSMIAESEHCHEGELYRRADGVCNNLENPLWGAAMQTQLRLLENAYNDHVGIPRILGDERKYLPSAREISNKCFPRNQETSSYLDEIVTQMSMQFGQYIDHDISFTEVQKGSGCCSDPRHTCIHPDTFDGGPCFPIGIEEDDHFFNKSCMPFKRSFSVDVNGVQEQVSGITSFLDASTVYGSYQTLQYDLRTDTDACPFNAPSFPEEKEIGLLKMEEGHLLPEQGNYKCRMDRRTIKPPACPHAGDVRVNVFPGLSVMHLIFVREHNRIAKILKDLNRCWDSETIFQETRKIIIAFHQLITYNEYLPQIVGPETMELMKLDLGNYEYDPTINPSVFNEFSTAAFRFGHSQVNSVLTLDDYVEDISDTFFQHVIHGEDIIKSIIQEQTTKKAQKVDIHFSTEVQDKLFKNGLEPHETFSGTDLGARNIQRGRDHGLAPYLEYLDLCIQNFLRKNITETGVKFPDCTPTAYNSVKDVDLFVGGISEEPIRGGLVGPTFAYIIGKQFHNLKFGDRYYFETPDERIGFKPDQLAEIKKQSLASIFCRNSKITHMQPNVFYCHKPHKNGLMACNKYKDINWNFWWDPSCQAMP